MAARPVLAVLLVPLVLLFGAGCGSGGGGGSDADPATVTPADAPVFIEATLRPEGATKANVESLAKAFAGVEDLGQKIIEEAEKASHDSGKPLDYEKEIEPWLGDRAGLYLERYDGDEFHGFGVAIGVTDTAAAREFVSDHAKSGGDESFESGSYEGVEYKVDPSDETTVGVVEDFLVVAEDPRSFRAMVDASAGESLAAASAYEEATAGAPSDSFADVFVDIGGLVRQAGNAVDPETRQVLGEVGLDPRQATALASVVPGSGQVEIDLSSNLGGANPPSGDASKLLGELPADSTAALVSANFGKRFGGAIDELDANGLPGQIPPHQLKKAMAAAGIDLEKISANVGDLGAFVTGSNESDLGGAIVLEARNPAEAKNTVADVGLLLRATQTPGVTALGGNFSGFSVRSAEIGSQPLVVAAAGERIAIAAGLRSATAALAPGGPKLASDPTYKEAVEALGGAPISGFAVGPPAVRLAAALIPADKRDGFEKAEPYLRKIDYLAIAAGADGDRSTVKLVAGVGR